MTFLNILRLSTAFSLSMAVSSYSLIFASQQVSMQEECVAAAFANPISKSNDQRLQELEDQRDAVDFRDYPRFKELTCEISSIIGSFPAKGALPKGEELHRWVDSIIRTRHKFSGQACLGKYGMANRYLQSVDDLDNPEHRNHMIVIMAIDAMAKRAIEDEDFSAMWSAQTLDGAMLDEFIEKVIETLNAGQFGWPKKKEKASFSVKIAPLETSDFSSETEGLEKKEKKSEIHIDFMLGSVVQDIFGYHNQRCDVYNTPLNEVFVDGALQTKADAVDHKTQLINTILKDRERVDVKRHASTDEKKAILQSVMGTEILAHTYQDEKRQILRLASELPVGLAITDPRFKHFEILRLTEEVSQKLVAHVREYGYESLYEVTLNKLIGNAYANLFAYSGLEEGVFFNWFKEVFESHKAGFLASTKPFDVDDLSKGVRAVLTKRPDIVRLAGDIFDLYAPKLDLKAVYNEIIPSGGKWRGWDVHQVDSFAHVINLTDEENKEYPATFVPQVFVDEEMGEPYILRRTDEVTGESYVVGENEPSLETQLRKQFSETLVESTYELYSTSHKAFLSPDDISLGTVRYIYDYCLEHRGYDVVGKGKLSFNLARKVKPELIHLLVKEEALSPGYITELYALALEEPSQEMYDFWYVKGMPRQIFMRGLDLFIRKQPLLSLEFLRNAVDLGSEYTREVLPYVLNTWGELLLLIKKNPADSIQQAIVCFQEAAVLKNVDAKRNLILCVKMLLQDKDKNRNISKALQLLHEYDLVSDFEVVRDFNRIRVDDYTIDYLRSKNIYDWGSRSFHAGDLRISSLFGLCGDVCFWGTNEVETAVECYRNAKIFSQLESLKKVHHAGDCDHQINLASYNRQLISCAEGFILGKNIFKEGENIQENSPKGLAILNGIVEEFPEMKQEIAQGLNRCGVVFLTGNYTYLMCVGSSAYSAVEITGFEKNIYKAIEFFRKAASLGDENACQSLINCAEILMGGLDVKRDMSQAITILRNLARSDLYRNDVILLLNQGTEFFSKGGDGIEKDAESARLCFEEAAKLV